MNKTSFSIEKWFWIAEDLHIRAILTTQSKSWYVQWQQPGHGKGRQRRQSLHTTSEKEARIRGARFARTFESGQIPTTALQAATVEKVMALKLDRLEADAASAHTLRLYKWYFGLLGEFLPRKGQTSLAMLTPLTLTAFATRLRTQGILLPSATGRKKRNVRVLSPRTIRETLKAVRGLTRLAKSMKLIAHDPTEGYVLPKGKSREIQVFSPPELYALFADPQHGDLWKFLAHTALRLEEFCWLTQADVILDAHGQPASIHIRHKICPQTGQEWWPKQKIERIVPLQSVAAAVLAKAMAGTTGPWVFVAPATLKTPAGKWLARRLQAVLRNRLEACGITHGTPHVFRHTCASYLANTAKMPVTLLQRFLGHGSLESTMRYLHTCNEDVAQALLDGDFSSLSAPAPASPSPPGLPAPTPAPAHAVPAPLTTPTTSTPPIPTIPTPVSALQPRVVAPANSHKKGGGQVVKT